MLKLYSLQGKRLELLPGYKAIVTNSEHMRREYLKHGIERERIHDLLYDVRSGWRNVPPIEDLAEFLTNSKWRRNGAAVENSGNGRHNIEWRLLFLGRMDYLKGGSVFLDALPQINAALKTPLRVTFVGDGPQRRIWERKANRVQARHPDVRIQFTGWLKGAPLDSSMTDCDLLVLPSLWPEPFGIVGPEMGLRGVPVAAFAVGGIPNWLIDGFNGHIASGDPPIASGLAEAVIKCLSDPATHARLAQGATEMARRFNMQTHVNALLNVFERVISVI
ncbi:MAG TPA: glycosyltransferase family 4 protein [Pyrinomonadaceae bacterium]|nr:glycosyltransferase family 4 protein [Pyrinomonadaceae bacterium]